MGNNHGRPVPPAVDRHNVVLVGAVVVEEEEEPQEEPTREFLIFAWFERTFRNKWLYPTREGNLEDIEGQLMYSLEFHHAERQFRDIFLQWRPLRRATLYSLLGNARNLEGKSKDVDIANLSGSVAGAAGGIVSVVGLALTPVTLGASLIVTAVGLAVGIAGGVTSGGALTTDLIVNSMARKYFDRLIAQDHRATMQTQGALRQMQDVVVRFSTWESKRPEVFAQGRGLNDSIFAFIKLTKQLAYLVLKGDDCTKTALSIGRLFAVTADSGAEALTIAKSSGMGAKVASTGVRTISAASIGFAAAGLVLDVGMIGYLSYRIHTGSKNANAAEIREIRSKLQKELCVMQRVNNELEIQ